jgi:hypothetical protein
MAYGICEHLGGELTVTFPRPARHEVHEIDLAKWFALQELSKSEAA